LTRITLRLAARDDLSILERWDRDPDVNAASGKDDFMDWRAELVRSADWREFLIILDAGRPVGFMQIIDPAREESRYWGECAEDLCAIDIWIGSAADRGRGIGAEAMRLALDRCFSSARVAAVLVDPLATNVRAMSFYERLGFNSLGPRRFGDDDCIVYEMSRAAWLARPQR